jgi:hypothetical protein
MRNALAGAALALLTISAAAAQTPPASGIELTVRTPQPERFELALDEIEIQWRGERGTRAAQRRAATATARATVRKSSDAGTVFTVRDARAAADLREIARGLEQQNAGGVAHLVLYDAGKPHSEASRKLLGREVAVILNETIDASAILSPRVKTFRRMPAVPNAYIAEAADPLAALALADELAAVTGVETAYPLLQRRRMTR